MKFEEALESMREGNEVYCTRVKCNTFKIENGKLIAMQYGRENSMIYIPFDDIIKGDWKIVVDILDEVEKRYLRDILRPFVGRKVAIKKLFDYEQTDKHCSYLCISIDNHAFNLPPFETDSMYVKWGMNISYTPEDLGIWKRKSKEN